VQPFQEGGVEKAPKIFLLILLGADTILLKFILLSEKSIRTSFVVRPSDQCGAPDETVDL